MRIITQNDSDRCEELLSYSEGYCKYNDEYYANKYVNDGMMWCVFFHESGLKLIFANDNRL